MPETTAIPQISGYLAIRGWKSETSPIGEILITSPSGEWRVQITAKDGWAAIHHFTGVPSRWKLEAECDGFNAMRDQLTNVGALEWECPNCGETGGRPRETSERYMYGADADGNRGEMRWDVTEGCSKCIR